jgi:PTH1 family peptidyl-tRNA hydrolase
VKIVVGLGNPGAEYAQSRHNAGFMVVDRLAARRAPGAVARSNFHAITVEASLPGAGKCLLMKPTTYMNRSGQAVADAVRFYKVSPVEDLLVVVDDTALPIGSIRVRAGGGAGGHNGLADIERLLGSEVYARLRVGVGAPFPGAQRDYVLGRFSPEQWEQVGPAVDKAVDAVESWAASGVTTAMNRFNPATEPGAEKRPPRDKHENEEGDRPGADGPPGGPQN